MKGIPLVEACVRDWRELEQSSAWFIFYLKQLAQEAVLTVPGVAALKNEVHVADRATRP